VESLLAHLPPKVHAHLEDPAFLKGCEDNFRDIKKNSSGSGCLEGEELTEAVRRMVPDVFLQDRLHETNLKKLILSFDADGDNRISQTEFNLFCMWTVAMDVLGFFSGTSPFAKIADVVEPMAKNLLIVSEFLDPEHHLENCVLPSTVCAYYHPDGLTMDEFSEQIKAAAHVRTRHGNFFESVALANHGPDKDGLWSVCSDHPVSLRSLDAAWPKVLPMFQALASMVAGPVYQGHVDLLACNFAANTTGVECIKMIEKQVNARFAASTDETGNVECGGNWELELGGRSVAPIYFHEHMLGEFTKVMAGQPFVSKAHCKPQLTAGSGDCTNLNARAKAKAKAKAKHQTGAGKSEDDDLGFV